MNQAQYFRHFSVISDQRELDLGMQVFVNPLQPFDMGEGLVNAQADELAVQLTELGIELLESVELRGADGCEIPWMAKENKPFALQILGLWSPFNYSEPIRALAK